MIDTLEVHPMPRAPRRRFSGLLLLSIFLLILVLLGQWLWLTQMPDAPIRLPTERAPLLPTLLRQQAIVWSLIVSATSMTMAIIVAVSPLSWWLYVLAALGHLPGVRGARAGVWGQAQQSAEEWVAAQTTGLPTAEAPGVVTAVAGAETATPSQAGTVLAAPQAQPGAQPPAAQPPGSQPPGTQPPGAPQAQPGTQPPGAPQAQPQLPATQQPLAQSSPQQAGAPQPIPSQPGAPQPQPQVQPPPAAQSSGAPQQSLQQLLTQEETVDLKELTDIGDILSSFKDNDAVSPYLLTLSQSLDDLAVGNLVAGCRRVRERLAQGQRKNVLI